MVTLRFKVISLTLAKALNSWVIHAGITYLITTRNNDFMKPNSDNTCKKS